MGYVLGNLRDVDPLATVTTYVLGDPHHDPTCVPTPTVRLTLLEAGLVV